MSDTRTELGEVAPATVDIVTRQLMRVVEAVGEFSEGEFEPVRNIMRYQAEQMLKQVLATGEILLATEVTVVPDDDGER